MDVMRSAAETGGSRVARVERLIAHPLAVAACLAMVYIVVCAFYIVYSDRLAAALAGSQDNYMVIQTYKGLAFVVMSGLMLFLFSYGIFRLLEQRRRQIHEHAEALVRAENRALSGIFAASVAHDINNILTVLIGHAEMLDLNDDLPPDARDGVRAMGRSLERLTELVKFLATVGREQTPGRRETLELAPLLAEVADLAAAHRLVKGRRLELVAPEGLTCRVNPQTIRRAVLNLLVNAADATGPQGRIVLSAAAEADGKAVVAVDDDGPGVPPEERSRIFRDFYTTKAQGNGLGLVSVKYCAQENEGECGVDASDLGGARFFVRFPLVGA